MEERVIKLLDYLGLDHDTEVEEVEYSDNTYRIDGKEYLVLTDEEANTAHEEYIKNFIDDCGVSGFTEFAQEYILEECLDASWFDEAMKESYENYASDIENEDSDNEEYENRLEEEMADAGCEDEDSFVEHLCSSYDSGVQWYKDNFGDSDFSEAINKHCSIDIGKVSEFCIEHDGRGHSLASYDGDELELADDYYAYRIN